MADGHASLRHCEVLLFDLDGTLVDSATGIAKALSEVSRRRTGGPVTAEQVRPLVSAGAETLVAEALGSVRRDIVADLAEFRAALAAIPPDPASIYPGVIAALTQLWSQGYGMAVVTNKPEALSRQLLDKLDLARFFQLVVGGDTTAYPKPHPEPLRLALARLGTPPTRAAFVGDSAVDAAAAEAMAMPFLLFEGGYDPAGCLGFDVAARFGHHAQLPTLLQS